MANVVKDIGEIWTRLFDHRPFLNGEIKYFVREIEEKRSDREVEGLFQILQTISEIKDSQIDRVKLSAESLLPPLSEKIDFATKQCQIILERDAAFRNDKTLDHRRELRKAEWESFIEDITNKCAKVDTTFQEKENDLRAFYLDLERKLHISPTHSTSHNDAQWFNIGSITDPTVYISPSGNLINFVKSNVDSNDLNKRLKDGEDLGTDDLRTILGCIRKNNNTAGPFGEDLDDLLEEMVKKGEKFTETNSGPFLHEVLSGSSIELPVNPVIPRNPELAARIDRLRREQDEMAYRAMTKDVSSAKYRVEDSIGYQIQMMNRQLIAVGQVILSVGAGFAFGFFGVPLAIGGLEFGARVLLGLMAAITIAIAEFYFLAKHLSYEDERYEADIKATEKLTATGGTGGGSK